MNDAYLNAKEIDSACFNGEFGKTEFINAFKDHRGMMDANEAVTWMLQYKFTDCVGIQWQVALEECLDQIIKTAQQPSGRDIIKATGK